ncbi:MAG: hypothetical protein J0H86_22755 [Xanthomonadaceae bacterium]|nr:hypothetical protein [Xanthomonadaceae bacterium]
MTFMLQRIAVAPAVAPATAERLHEPLLYSIASFASGPLDRIRCTQSGFNRGDSRCAQQ